MPAYDLQGCKTACRVQGLLRSDPWGRCLVCKSRDKADECTRRLSAQPNVRANRAPTVGRQARTGENVPRTARPGLVARRWCSG
jgi:hypothetical protein